MNHERIKKIVKDIHTLPTLPLTYSKINELINKPRTCAMDIAEVIKKDQVLTVRLLKLVNSSFYGFSGRIKTVSNAVVILGFNSIKNLVLSTSVMNLFKDQKENNYFDMLSFWKHSLSVACVCKILASYLDFEDLEEFFVAGLLHDLGKLIENQYLEKDFDEVLKKSYINKIPLFEVEMKEFGLNHGDLGLLLCEKWQLPEYIKECMAFHHFPEKAKKFSLYVDIVHLSNIIVKALELGKSGDHWVSPVSMKAWENIQLPIAVIESVMRKSMKEAKEVFKVLKPSSDARDC